MATKKGGKRNGAGRKKGTDNKVQISIYPRKSSIKKVGGKKTAKALALAAIEPQF